MEIEQTLEEIEYESESENDEDIEEDGLLLLLSITDVDNKIFSLFVNPLVVDVIPGLLILLEENPPKKIEMNCNEKYEIYTISLPFKEESIRELFNYIVTNTPNYNINWLDWLHLCFSLFVDNLIIKEWLYLFIENLIQTKNRTSFDEFLEIIMNSKISQSFKSSLVERFYDWTSESFKSKFIIPNPFYPRIYTLLNIKDDTFLMTLNLKEKYMFSKLIIQCKENQIIFSTKNSNIKFKIRVKLTSFYIDNKKIYSTKKCKHSLNTIFNECNCDYFILTEKKPLSYLIDTKEQYFPIITLLLNIKVI